jgi:hypothetical protein
MFLGRAIDSCADVLPSLVMCVVLLMQNGLAFLVLSLHVEPTNEDQNAA